MFERTIWSRVEGRRGLMTDIIKVNVGAPILGKDEVSDRVRLLDMVFVVLEINEKPGVFCFDEISGRFPSPELAKRLRQP